MFTVYIIVNRVNGKVYVGQTRRSVEQRWKQHVQDVKRKDHAISRAIRKYGSASFHILQTCPAKDQQEANVLEKAYVSMFSSNHSSLGYNSTSGGDCEWEISEELRQKYSRAKKGKPSPKKGFLIRSDVTSEDIIRDYNSGLSFSDLSKKYRLSFSAIKVRLYQPGVKIRPSGGVGSKGKWRVSFPVEEASSLYESGLTLKQISERFGIGTDTVWKRLKAFGTKMRPEGLGKHYKNYNRAYGGQSAMKEPKEENQITI